MRSLLGQVSFATWGRAAVVAVALLGAVQTATAEDGDFFSSIFGGGTQQAAPQTYAPPAEPVEQPIYRRPLTVKLHRPKVMRQTKVEKPVGQVSIYQDKTLRRGDAVMTAKGIRIFAGSSSWPYREDDFVAISAAGRMDKSYQKVLLDLDRLPQH